MLWHEVEVVKVHRNGLEEHFDARGQTASLYWVEYSELGYLVQQTLFVIAEGFQLSLRLSSGSVTMTWLIVRCCCSAPTGRTALGSPVAVRSARSVWVGSRRLWVVPLMGCRYDVWALVLAARVVLQMRRWLEVSSLVLLVAAVPQMRHSVSASLVLVQAGRR